MKKTILVCLAGLVLLLTGCTTADQDIDQSATDVNQPVADDQELNQPADPTADWKSYEGNGFSVKYPPYLSQEVEQVGVRTTISFQGTESQSDYTSLLSIAVMPNQAGSTLDEWTNGVISQSKWIKQGSVKISGQTAYILILPETDAGSRYVFLSKDSRTIFDMTIQHFDKETTDLIISSFLLEEPGIAEKYGAEIAKSTLIDFFDYLSKNEFEKAVNLFSPDEADWESLKDFSPIEEANDKAKVLENYCKATLTCLKAKVLEVKEMRNGEYSLVVQFLNNDGSIYIFGPCCGATEKEMPSKDKFDYIVKKIDDTFRVMTAPLYRP